jgi:hypothetical protein
MSDEAPGADAAYHLFLAPDEVPVLGSALRLFISDEAHQPQIRRLGREVLAALEADPEGSGLGRTVTVPLTPEQMKITHGAVKLLLDDLQREQAIEREVLRSILEKLPDEHTMRAIVV